MIDQKQTPQERKTVLALRKERRRQRLSATKLAEITGVSRSGICHIEADRSRPTFAMLLKIAEGLGVKLKDFMD